MAWLCGLLGCCGLPLPGSSLLKPDQLFPVVTGLRGMWTLDGWESPGPGAPYCTGNTAQLVTCPGPPLALRGGASFPNWHATNGIHGNSSGVCSGNGGMCGSSGSSSICSSIVCSGSGVTGCSESLVMWVASSPGLDAQHPPPLPRPLVGWSFIAAPCPNQSLAHSAVCLHLRHMQPNNLCCGDQNLYYSNEQASVCNAESCNQSCTIVCHMC